MLVGWWRERENSRYY